MPSESEFRQVHRSLIPIPHIRRRDFLKRNTHEGGYRIRNGRFRAWPLIKTAGPTAIVEEVF